MLCIDMPVARLLQAVTEASLLMAETLLLMDSLDM